ncbi:hypothetical protein C8R46DRAFT_1065048 [Mycena filopes]|nr:hypothetical protein C8R46DRAFT_1065048 [Mycena filopes]
MQHSELFNAADADVVFESSDGVLFNVHRVNLQTHTEGFPPAEIAVDGQICPLSEGAATLEVLFQFIYPRRHPTLDDMAFADVAALAEAAEKYQVYSAMNICHLRMKAFLPDHAPEVLTYAARHDYPTVVAEVAPLLIDMSLVDVVTLLPPHILLPWIKYREEWEKLVRKMVVSVQQGHRGAYNTMCDHCASVRPFDLSISSLRHLDMIVVNAQRPNCVDYWKQWQEDLRKKIAAIPKFATFL